MLIYKVMPMNVYNKQPIEYDKMTAQIINATPFCKFLQCYLKLMVDLF